MKQNATVNKTVIPLVSHFLLSEFWQGSIGYTN